MNNTKICIIIDYLIKGKSRTVLSYENRPLELPILEILDTARLSDSHQLHIPKAVWEKFQLKSGDLMGFYEPEEGQLIIRKANP